MSYHDWLIKVCLLLGLVQNARMEHSRARRLESLFLQGMTAEAAVAELRANP